MDPVDLVVRGGWVLVDGGLVAADVLVHKGRVHAVEADAEAGGAAVVDAEGLVVAPGFVDLQCNGAGGFDLTAEPESLWEVAALLPRWGVTSWLPTIVTSPEATRRRALAVLREGPPDDSARAEPLGYHFEGPFLSPERKGAHAVQHLRLPEVAAVESWTPEAGVALVTLAPELPGALDVLRTLVDRGIVVSLGHSTATAAEATAGVDAGARWATHLFNAMAPLHHRDPGLAGVALTDERLSVGVIADGLHMHPLMVDLAWRALDERLTLVTDAVAALGMPPGLIRLGDMEALADDEGVRLANGTLAGSNLSMDRAVANLMGFAGVDVTEAVAAATLAPARLLGIEDERGAVSAGGRADLVVLDEELDVVATLVGGEVAYDRREPPWKS